MAVPIKGRKQGAQDAQQELPSRRLAAIMFTDLVGYSALAHRDEALAIELLELHRGWVRELLPRYGGQEIETVGDAFLIVFAGALSAVECAIALQERFAAHNKAEPARRMQLRIGIHLGDIEHRAGKVMGDGVNIASRIHGTARPGGICVSEDVHRAVRNRAGLRFTSLGTPDLKNISTRLELYELHAGPDSLRNEVVAKARRTVGRVPKWLLYPFLAIALVSFFGDGDEDRVKSAVRVEPGAGAPALPSPSSAARAVVMVPPFDHRGAEAFSDGLHRAVIEQLGRVEGLQVISMASALSNPVADLRKLGSEGGLTHVLVAEIEQSGQHVGVEVRLLDVKADSEVWDGEYDRELGDAAAVQADVAQRIVAGVLSKVLPRQ